MDPDDKSKKQSSKTGRRVVKAIKHLIKVGKSVGTGKQPMGVDVGSSESSSKEKGISLEQVEKWIREKCGAEKAETIEAMKAAVTVEVGNGQLVELSDGRYALPSSAPANFSSDTPLPRRAAGRQKTEEAKGRSSFSKTQPLAVVTTDVEMPASTTSTSADVTTPSTAVSSPKKVGCRRKKMRKSLEADGESVVLSKKARQDVAADDETKVALNDAKPSVSLNTDATICTYCQSATNRAGNAEGVLCCKDCPAKVHPSCMDFSEELAHRASRSPWQCCNCKTCTVCDDSGDADEMLFCDACDKGYHTNCHCPPVLEKPTGKWICNQCVLELEAEVNAPVNVATLEIDTATVDNKATAAECGGGTSCLPTPSDSPVHFQEEVVSQEIVVNPEPAHIETTPVVLPKLSATLTGEIPDASNWSVADVAKFFVDLGFTEQAETFRAEEIDGKALLLMTRNDVLTGMSFKLGPALKIHAHVHRLQTHDANFIC
jgi:hypothetical protein